MNDWQMEPNQWRDSNPYGKRIENYIMRYPQWIVYLRKDPSLKCADHWDPATSTPKSLGVVDCACLGFGVLVTPEIVPCRMTLGRKSEVSPLDKTDLGFMTNLPNTIHFPRGVYPVENDVVLVCSWNVPANQIPKANNIRPVYITATYQIKQMNPYWFRNVEYFSCGMESIDIDMAHFNKLIPSKFANLEVKEVGTWPQESYW